MRTTSADNSMVNVSSFCDILKRLTLIWSTCESNSLQYSIILKHFSCVNKLSLLNYECFYPISNRYQVEIPYLVMKYHYFENCAHDLCQWKWLDKIRYYLAERCLLSNYLCRLSKSQTLMLLWYSNFLMQSMTNHCLTYNLAFVRML